MADSLPHNVIDDAVALLNTDPLLRAARDITVAAMRGGFEDDPKVAAAASVIVASRVPAEDPAREYTMAEIHNLAEWAAQVAQKAGLLWMRQCAHDNATMTRFDETWPELQAAARALAALRGGR